MDPLVLSLNQDDLLASVSDGPLRENNGQFTTVLKRVLAPDNPNYYGNGANITPANPRKEYVARSNSLLWTREKNYLSALPQATDDLDRILSVNIIRRMMQNPQLNSAINLIALSAVGNGGSIKPAIRDRLDTRYDDAILMQRLICDNIDQLEYSFSEILVDIAVGGMCMGNSVSEQTWALQDSGQWKGKLMLDCIKPKVPEVYFFAIDKYGNVPGIGTFVGEDANKSTSNYLMPNIGILSPGLIGTNLGPGWQVIDIKKFVVLTHRKQYGDPRGQSALKPAYTAWRLLMQIMPEYLKYLVQFASPSIVGELPERAIPEMDSDGNLVDPIDTFFDQLESFMNGCVIAVRNGSKITLQWSQGDGTAFINAIGLLNHEMVKAVTYQSLATEEGKHQARAASATHQDVLNTGIRGIKNLLVSAVTRQIFRTLIELNYGRLAAQSLTPHFSLGEIAPEDRGAILTAAALTGYRTGPDQWPAMDAEAELEVRSTAQAVNDFNNYYPDKSNTAKQPANTNKS